MRTRLALLSALLAFSVLPVRAGDKPAPLVDRSDLPGEAGAALGTHGVRVFRDGATWTAFQERLVALGWTGTLKPEFATLNFETHIIACVFRRGASTDQMTWRAGDQGAEESHIEVGVSTIIQKAGLHVESTQFVFVGMARSARLRVSAHLWYRAAAQEPDTPEEAEKQWEVVLAGDEGDQVGQLRGAITAEQGTVKPGEDIRLKFSLAFGPEVAPDDSRFARPANAVHVWDGKYSKGYRNHAFLVTLPDGTTRRLRPAVREEWDKNIPHLVEISKDRGYTLPEWREGESLKSLQALGLDTTRPGTYRITGIYAEKGEASDGARAWGGELMTNSVLVEVK